MTGFNAENGGRAQVAVQEKSQIPIRCAEMARGKRGVGWRDLRQEAWRPNSGCVPWRGGDSTGRQAWRVRPERWPVPTTGCRDSQAGRRERGAQQVLMAWWGLPGACPGQPGAPWRVRFLSISGWGE